MQGREIDVEKLMRENELMPAIGNMKVNARGDELGPGGKIIRKREDIVGEYYENNPNAAAAYQEPVVQPVVEPVVAPKTKKIQQEDTNESTRNN
jgi:hypothetical protein